MPSNTRNGKTPQKVSSFSVTSDAPIKRRKLREMFIPAGVEEEEKDEEKEVRVSLIRRKKIADAEA